jgi:hypothetical protein
MQVDVAAFAATLDRQGPVKLYNDGVVQVKLDAAPTANSRIDAIYVKQMETASPISDSADGPVFGKVTGTPSTSPTAPTIPVGAMRLADVTIPSTATSTSSGGVTITQRYPYTSSAGGLLQFRNSDDLAAWNAPDGYHARLLDGSEYFKASGAWKRARPVYMQAGAVDSATDSNGYVSVTFPTAMDVAPTSVLITNGPAVGGVTSQYSDLSLGQVFPTRFTVFSRNTQSAGSLANNPVKFHWLAVWQ